MSPWGLRTQLEFTWYELDSVGGYGLSALRGTATIADATVAFERDFEKCGTCDQTKRISYAHEVYNAYSTSGRSECYADSLGATVPDGSCIESGDSLYTCEDGDWVDAEIALTSCTDVRNVD